MARSQLTPAVSTSARLYRLLLAAYPARFRREYAEPMVQAFRDCCRDAQRRGVRELAQVWLLALRDLLATAPRERGAAIWHVMAPPLSRWSGPAAILGGSLWAATALAWIQPDADYAGPTSGPGGLYAVTNALFSPAALLLLVGLVGLQARRVGGSGWLAKLGFVLASCGAALIVATNILAGWLHLPPWWWSWWYVVTPGGSLLFAGLVFFGIATVRANGLARWRELPLVLGLLGWSTFYLPGSYRDLPTVAAWVSFGLGWVLLGAVLWSGTPGETEPPLAAG